MGSIEGLCLKLVAAFVYRVQFYRGLGDLVRNFDGGVSCERRIACLGRPEFRLGVVVRHRFLRFAVRFFREVCTGACFLLFCREDRYDLLPGSGQGVAASVRESFVEVVVSWVFAVITDAYFVEVSVPGRTGVALCQECRLVYQRGTIV